jgi:hypothetical protein
MRYELARDFYVGAGIERSQSRRKAVKISGPLALLLINDPSSEDEQPV